MKKTTLLLLFILFSISGYSQFTEGFESTTGPDALPSTNWTLGSGSTGNQWAVFDNGVGTAQRWGINAFASTLAYQGSNCASVSREFIGQNNTSEDYLSTPLVTIPTNGQLHFYTRMFTTGNQGTLYQIKVAPASASQTNPAAYTLVKQWDEVTLTTTYNVYEEKVVNLALYAGQQVYVSFVKVYTQPTTTLDGDRWLIDNVNIVQQCLDPTTLTATGITQTSANLSWANPSGATSWEIEVLPAAATATGVGIVYNGILPYPATTTATGAALTPSTAYKYYVRALCSSGASSIWVGPFPFSTTSPGLTCAAPIVIGALPYSTTDNTSNYGDTTDVAQPAACAGTATNYMTGNDVFYSYTPTANGTIGITMTPGATWSGIFVYDGCSNVGVTCVAGVANTGSGVRSIPSLSVIAGHQYIIVISTNAAPQTVGYTLVIQTVNCAQPTTLSATNVLQNSANLSWANPSGATSWEVAVQTAGSPIPSGSGVQTNLNTNYPVTGLTTNTAYQYYVRADCGNGTFSAWSGPFLFNTLCTAFAVPFQEGFNSTSPTQSCWTVLNVNADADAWDMNYATNPYEGDESAMMYTDFNAGANNDWLISPQIILNGNQRLKFHYRVQSAGEPNDFRVMLSTAGTAPANFTTTLLPTASYNNITYIQKTISLSGYTGPVNIAWNVPAGGLDGWRLYIDNVIIEDIPTCPEPSAIVSSNVLATSATIGWTNGGTETAWQVLPLSCGSAVPSASTAGIPANSNPFNLTGLTPSTCYDIYVRAVCSSTDNSPWIGPITITTQCNPFTIPFQEGFNTGSPTESCWTVLDLNNDSDAWNMNYATNPYEGDQCAAITTDFNAGANNDWLISPQLILNGNQRLRYRYRVQSSGEPNDFRVMLSTSGTGSANFTTTLVPLASYSNTTYAENIVSLAGISGTVNIGWHIPAGGLDGWRLYIDKVIVENLPTCFPPTTLTATNITSTSASLGWTDTNPTPATQWEVYYVIAGSPEPLPSATGTLVSANPALITGLNPGTKYDFYVRAVCSSTDHSEWSPVSSFTTLIINDNCSGAIFAPVNSSAICQQTTAGSIAGATASTPATSAPCVGTADDDVWFQFVASNPYLTVSLQNIVGSSTNLNFAVYSGACGTLTQIFCSAANAVSGVVTGMTLGQTYFIRVYSNESTPQTSTFNLCISTPSSCLSGQSACQNLSYPNIQGVIGQPAIGCLLDPRNPTYYTINVLTSGPINLLLTQSSTLGGAPNLDVDYAAWGPFTSQSSACAAIGNPPSLTPGIGVPVTQTTGCSFSAASTETLNIANALAGQVYVILITNYSNNPGFISLTQTNSSAPGAGYYECCPDAYFTYNPVSYCKSAGTANPIPTINNGSVAGVFSLSSASQPGLVFANTATGEIDLQASLPGNYLVLNTVAATASCAQKERGYNISIVTPLTATIAYGAAAYCKSITAAQPVVQGGTTGGTYSVSPNGGLYIDANSGAITPSLSAPGVYTVTYGLPGNGVCTTTNPSTTVEILPLPNIVQPAPVVACDSYTLPALAVGDYYSQSQLGGAGSTPLDISVPITTSQTVYIYAVSANGCPNEKSFTITINSVAAPTLNVTQPSCAIPTGTIQVTAPLAVGGGTPANLFISEVTDEEVGSLTYVEIYNGTGAAVNLNGYKLRVFNNGSNTASCDNVLTGTLNNNSTFVVAVGSVVNQGGVVPNQVFAGCGGVNTDDCIKLTTSTNTVIDLWGRTDGVAFTPLNQPGYTYRRLVTAPHPSTTWNVADWTAIDPQDYTNVGTYNYFTSNYEYALDSNPYQAGATFNNVIPGNHTVTVHDLITGCYSAPTSTTLSIADQIASTFNPTAICSGDAVSFPATSIEGYAGTWSPSTLDNTQTATYTFTPTPISGVCVSQGTWTVTVTQPTIPAFAPVAAICNGDALIALPTTSSNGYLGTWSPALNNTATTTYTFTPTVGQCATTATLTITVNPKITATFTPISICKGDAVAFPTASLEGYTGTWSPSTINNTQSGTYTFTPTNGQCADTGTLTVTVIQPILPLFTAVAPVCYGDVLSALPTTSSNNYTGTWSPALDNTATTTYTFTPTAGQCASTASLTITVLNPIAIAVNGECQGVNFVLTASPLNASFDPLTATYSWEDSTGLSAGNAQSVVVTNPETYTVTVTANGCSDSKDFNVDSIACVIQKGISANNDGLNDSFDLSGFNVKKLSIFNRFGMKVYSKRDYTNEWKGKSDNGDELPDGTYYYVIERDNGETKTGWIYINRAQ